MTTYSLNLNNLNKTWGDFTLLKDWEDLVCENEGSFDTENYMVFDCDGVEVVVNYNLYVEGNVFYDRGDAWSAPYSELNVQRDDVEITSVFIDDINADIDDDVKSLLISKVRKNF